MKEFYIKVNERYVPVSFKDIFIKDWEDKIVVMNYQRIMK